MKAKCNKCGAEFEIDRNRLKEMGSNLRCPKCEFDTAVNREKMESSAAPAAGTQGSLMKRIVFYNYFSLLKKPVVIFAAIIGGVLFGLYNKPTAVLLAPFGQVYLSLLKMCVFPILITAIVTSVGRLFVSKEASRYIVRILIIFAILLSFTGIIGLGVAAVGQPGAGLSKDAQNTLGKMLNESDKKFGHEAKESQKGGDITGFVRSIIPENIFHSLTIGSSLQILFFSIILGVATGFLSEIEGRLIISFSESLFKAFFGIIRWILYLLPFGLFCLVSSQIANTGIDILLAMTKFVVMIYITSGIIIATSSILLWYSTGFNVLASTYRIKDCLLIAFGTQSTFASMPSQLEGLKDLNVNTELANLVVPIGAVICRFSMVILYSVATVFTAQLYGVDMTFGNMAMALVLSVVAAVAGAGTPGIVSIAMVGIVLGQLGLPSDAIIVLLLAINPVVEPITTMANVHANVAATSLIAKGVDAEDTMPADAGLMTA